MQLHHIVPEEQGGKDTYENCIPLCLECHADVRAYDPKHPIGLKYTLPELRTHRDRWYEMIKKGTAFFLGNFNEDITSLPTRKEYNDTVIETIESSPKALRAILIGPHFLHPQWLVDERKRIEPRKSFREALAIYLCEYSRDRTKDIRLILRNSAPYPERLKYLLKRLKQRDVDDLIRDMLENLDRIFCEKRFSTISFCCMDPGHYHGVVITEKSCFIYLRETSESRIQGGYKSMNPTRIKIELDWFDKIFDRNFKGMDEEISILKNYILSHKDFI